MDRFRNTHARVAFTSLPAPRFVTASWRFAWSHSAHLHSARTFALRHHALPARYCTALHCVCTRYLCAHCCVLHVFSFFFTSAFCFCAPGSFCHTRALRAALTDHTVLGFCTRGSSYCLFLLLLTAAACHLVLSLLHNAHCTHFFTPVQRHAATRWTSALAAACAPAPACARRTLSARAPPPLPPAACAYLRI